MLSAKRNGWLWVGSGLCLLTLSSELFYLGYTLDPDLIESYGYYFQQHDEDSSPVARYLWLWIKWVCYSMGGVAGAAGIIMGIFGFWVGRGPIIKQGLISAAAGFAFILVIPFTRIVFVEWIDFAEEDPFVPEVTTAIEPPLPAEWMRV